MLLSQAVCDCSLLGNPVLSHSEQGQRLERAVNVSVLPFPSQTPLLVPLGLRGGEPRWPHFFCPTALGLAHGNHSVMPVELNSGFSGPPASNCLLPFPWQIAAFSSQQLLVRGPKVPGRPLLQDQGVAVPTRPGLHRPKLGPREMESF